MVALVALVLILALLGGLGFAVHVLWYVLIVALLLWLIGFFIGARPWVEEDVAGTDASRGTASVPCISQIVCVAGAQWRSSAPRV